MLVAPQIITNRAAKVVHSAFDRLGSKLLPYRYLRPFSYWDNYYGLNPDITQEYFQLLDYATIQRFENKGYIARRVAELGIKNVFPKSYFSVADVFAEQPGPDAIWFVKPTHLTGGKGITCHTTESLKDLELPKHYFIQQQVTDIELYEGRKYTARAYVFIHNKKLYVFDDGFVMIHGLPYDEKSTDFATQVDHRGYHIAGSPIKMKQISELPHADRKLESIQNKLHRLKPVLAEMISKSSDVHYGLLGIDLLFTRTHDALFIELNSKSNFIHTELINDSLNSPFFSSFLTTLYTGEVDARLTQI
ncbi:hypothetical protein J6I90_05715 [Pseudidiomarina sp. 1APP75-32.1]|uniref:ATP-grasp domain-containing protein n=1 Tax=Pseudidiomarina terrestris TaxID=2820060 RepID=A0AAW7QVU8_9GAMM|nr:MULTISPECIES: hypothetical protein [unclassified Pseudidiomarina]MDN7124370.1 hypothetical protein [Pseudidiomarina sp. 1APP75-32.1]MDN7129339.1 hypothetical protein [Pseudidiomarina sp. 1APR75-15]